MPELPEVETVRRILSQAAVAKRVTAIACTRPKLVERLDGARALDALVGARLVGVDRRAKWLTLRFDGDTQALLHLRMTGQIATIAPDGARAVAGHPVPAFDAPLPATTTHLTITFDDGTLVYLQDPRHFATLTLLPAALLDDYLHERDLGPEPLDDDFTVGQFSARLASRGRAKLKPLLLDQSFVSGLGNIYADEALHLAWLHPERTPSSLSTDDVARLHRAMRAVLEEAIPIGGAKIERSKATQINGFPRVHAREGEPCPTCGTPIVKYTLAGRGTYFCRHCQTKSKV
jgi:formamidopyrimidine-DNA glycosylase